MKSLSTLFRNVDDMKDLMKEPRYSCTGFDFVLDSPENEAQEVLEPEQGMPRVQGFVYEFDGNVYGEQTYIDVDVINGVRLLEKINTAP